MTGSFGRALGGSPAATSKPQLSDARAINVKLNNKQDLQ